MSPTGELFGLTGPFTDRRLFSEHFVTEVLPGLPDYAGLDLGDVPATLTELWQAERARRGGRRTARRSLPHREREQA